MNPPISICNRCGVTWSSVKGACSGCGSADASPRPFERASHDFCWVASFAHFTCRTCGESSPMHGLEADCKVACGSCGQVQLLAPEVFSKAMKIAWELGDYVGRGGFPLDDDEPLLIAPESLAGMGGEYMLADYEDEGLERGQVDRSRSIRMQLSAGRALCETCNEPLSASSDATHLSVECARCDTAVLYALPENPHEISPFPIGVVEGDLRDGVADVRVESTVAGVFALKCPSCSASLTSIDGRGLSRCDYCKTLARVESGLRRNLAASTEASTKPFWLVFRGPSPTRRALESRAAKRAARMQREANERLAPRPEANQGGAQTSKPASPSPAIVMAGVGLSTVGLAASLFFLGNAPAPATPTIAAPASVAPTVYAPPPPPPPQLLPEACGCPIGDGTTVMRWAIDIQSTMRFGADVTIDAQYLWSVGDSNVPVLTNDQSAPPRPIRTLRLELGVACTPEAMIVADGRFVSAWSLVERRIVATAAVPSPFAPRELPDQPMVECTRADLSGSEMRFTDGGGFAHRIALPPELDVDPSAQKP